jgi:hypothetical protein
MIPNVDYGRLVSVNEMRGEDEQETQQLQATLEEARAYLKRFSWCRSVDRELFGLGVGGVVSVFLFEISGDAGVDPGLWVVCGDLPTAYLVTDEARTPTMALERYCQLMDEWVASARGKGKVSDAFPVGVEPTEQNASSLERRVAFLRSDVIPAFTMPG